jgi:hypothetical protein
MKMKGRMTNTYHKDIGGKLTQDALRDVILHDYT